MDPLNIVLQVCPLIFLINFSLTFQIQKMKDMYFNDNKDIKIIKISQMELFSIYERLQHRPLEYKRLDLPLFFHIQRSDRYFSDNYLHITRFELKVEATCRQWCLNVPANTVVTNRYMHMDFILLFSISTWCTWRRWRIFLFIWPSSFHHIAYHIVLVWPDRESRTIGMFLYIIGLPSH